MAAAITARSGSGTVVKAQTAVHIEITGSEANVANSDPVAVTAVSVANPTVITAASHGFTTGDTVIMAGFSTTPTINGSRVVTVTGAGTFTIPVNVSAVADGVGTAEKSISVLSGLAVGTERRFYVLVDAPVGVDDARSHVFQVSSDGKHTWDDYIFPAAGTYTLRLRDMLDDSDEATASVVVAAS